MTPLSPRPGLRDVAPYDSPQLPCRARLNTNECPVDLPPAFHEDLARTIGAIPLNRYPDGQMTTLRTALSERHSHPLEGVWAANGSNEILTQLLQAYGGPGRRAVMFEPTYLLYSRLCRLTQTEPIPVRLEPPFSIGEHQISAARSEDPDIIFICSPNNPTGNTQPVDIVERLAAVAPDTLVVLDEAYIDFGGQSALTLVADHPNIVIVRTFSKAFAMAGARIGYALASPAVVEDLQRVRLPYHLSALTQTAAIVALRHVDEALGLLGQISIQRDRIITALTAIEGCTVFPSNANFVLFIPPRPATDVWRLLLDRGVLVRDMAEAVPGALRVTAGTAEETDLFIGALVEILTSDVSASTAGDPR